jgi:hypothetical protein
MVICLDEEEKPGNSVQRLYCKQKAALNSNLEIY